MVITTGSRGQCKKALVPQQGYIYTDSRRYIMGNSMRKINVFAHTPTQGKSI